MSKSVLILEKKIKNTQLEFNIVTSQSKYQTAFLK